MKIIFRCLMFIIRDESVKFLDFPFLINIKLFFSSLFLFFIFFYFYAHFYDYLYSANINFMLTFCLFRVHTRKYRHILLPFFFTISFGVISLKIYTCAIAYISYIHLHASMLHLFLSFLSIYMSVIHKYINYEKRTYLKS